MSASAAFLPLHMLHCAHGARRRTVFISGAQSLCKTSPAVWAHNQLHVCLRGFSPAHLLTFISSLNISEVAASPGRTGDQLVSDLVSGVGGDSTRSIGARLCASRIRPEPPRALEMDVVEREVMNKMENMSSVYDFDPITGNIPATKVEVTVSCRSVSALLRGAQSRAKVA